MPPDAGTTYERRFFTYDPFGRMTAVHSDSGKTVLIAEYRYNGLGQRIMWRYDQNANGTVASTERFFYMYDDRWRMVGAFWDSGSTPQESFVYHAAGNAGRGSSSYIDSVVMRDRDTDANGTLEERRYYVQNWRADVVAITKSDGNPLQYVVYSPYGEAVTHAVADVDLDGDVDSNDQAAWANGVPTGSFAYAALEDLNHDGTDSAADDALFDESYADNLGLSGRGRLTAAKLNNRKGYAGYEHDESLTMYHVRHRVYRPDLGRWMTRDPLGYVDGMGLYEYVRGMAVRGRDPSGLARAVPCVPGQCVVFKDPGAIPEVPPGHGNPGLTIEQCNQCVRDAESDSGNAGLIRELRRRGCGYSVSCENCADRTNPGSKGWSDPSGLVTLCANRMPNCDYAKTMLAHELFHVYDFCQNNIPPDASCCDCVCYELRAYRWDRGCADGGIRRSRPGPDGEPTPRSEWECLRLYVGRSCTGEGKPCATASGTHIDNCFSAGYSSSNCSPHSIVPIPTPIIRPGPPREI